MSNDFKYPKHIANTNINVDYLTQLFKRRKITEITIHKDPIPIDQFIKDLVELVNNNKILKKNLDDKRSAHNKLSSKTNPSKEDIEIAKKSKIDLNKDEDLYESKDDLANYLLSYIPARLHDSVPENDVIVATVGNLSSKIKQNLYKGLECETVFGSKLVVKDDKICKLERALINWCMHKLSQNGFIEKGIPSLIKQELLYSVGHLPHSEKDMFLIDDKYGLSPTGEVGLMSYLSSQNHNSAQTICTVNQCYRGESGASGAQNKGLYRLHEFTKCEMVVICPPSQSYEWLHKMVKISSDMIVDLELPMRIVELGAEEIGNHSCKTYDIQSCVNEIWTEVASISNCEDYQTLGLKIKINGEICHSLNGTGLALSRVVAAIIETYYNESTQEFTIPKVLKPYYID